MFSLRCHRDFLQELLRPILACLLVLAAGFHAHAVAADKTAVTLCTAKKPKAATAATVSSPKKMKAYTEAIPGTGESFDMVPIKGGTFVMGSPNNEPKRKKDEGPQHKVSIEPFWMGKHEITWELYDVWSFSLDIQRRKILRKKPHKRDKVADAVTRPTAPYVDMSFDMGHDGFPAICMTQLAAKTYCQWLSAKTGRYYRLPTEAEWEYACRAGTITAYSFGNDPKKLDDHAWHYDNSDDGYHKVGLKKPNPWGLYDMHGNVAEWTLDQYHADFYQKFSNKKLSQSPLAVPSAKIRYSRVVRGGSWDDDAEILRSGARVFSVPAWKQQDPQLPQSIWYLTDALGVGFRVVRPLRVPDTKERGKLYLEPVTEDLEKR